MELGFTIIDDISHVPPQSFCIVKIPTLPVIFLALSVGQIISGPDLPVQVFGVGRFHLCKIRSFHIEIR